jgi:type VI protein secretion system component VasK
MNTIAVFLAQVRSGDGFSWDSIRERFIIFGSIGLVTLLLLLWAVLVRKKRRRRHSHHHWHHTPKPADAPATAQNEDASAPPEKRRRRHSRHRHRPRNPSLAETGGLPPIRPDIPPKAEP